MSEIEIVTEPEAPNVTVDVVPDAVEPKERDPAQGLADLQKQIADSSVREAELRAERDRIANEARQMAAIANQAQQHGITAYQFAVDAQIEAAQKEMDQLVANQSAMMNEGNFAEASQLNAQISKLAARTDRLESEKEARQNQPVPQVRPQVSDPVEAALQGRYSSRAADWFRGHRNMLQGDGNPKPEVLAAHYKAESQKFVVDSDAYFDFVERELGLKDQPADPKPSPSVRSAMPAAPVSRDAADGGNTPRSKVSLTPGEVKSATDGSLVWNTGPKKGQPIGVQEMAKRKQLLQSEGKYDRIYAQ